MAESSGLLTTALRRDIPALDRQIEQGQFQTLNQWLDQKYSELYSLK